MPDADPHGFLSANKEILQFRLTSRYLNSVWTQPLLVDALTTDVIIRTLIVERVHVSPATIGNQYNSRVEVSNSVRVLVHVDLLRRRHVDSHHRDIDHIDLLAPCTNGGETGPVVRPGGGPLHVAIVRARALNWSCVVAKTNE